MKNDRPDRNPYLDKLFFDIPQKEYPRIWNTLNSWNWSDDLGEPPDGWENMSKDEKFEITRPIERHIEIAVGKKAVLRYANVTQYDITDQMFDDWWDSLEDIDELLSQGRDLTQSAKFGPDTNAQKNTKENTKSSIENPEMIGAAFFLGAVLCSVLTAILNLLF